MCSAIQKLLEMYPFGVLRGHNCISNAKKLGVETQQGLYVQIIQHSLLVSMGQNLLQNGDLTLYIKP
jgi:hypothetical protein